MMKGFLNSYSISFPSAPETRKELHLRFGNGCAQCGKFINSIRPERLAWFSPAYPNLHGTQSIHPVTQYSGMVEAVMPIDKAMGRHGEIATKISLVC